MQTVEWLDLCFAAPEQWEISRHAVSRDKGSLVFVDRRSERLRVYWTACGGRPDGQLLLDGCRERDRQEHPDARFGQLPPAGEWRGYRWQDAGRSVTRAGLYDQRHDRWVEMVLTWPGSVEVELERAVLGSFRSANLPDGAHRYRAFGIDLTAPAAWVLEHAQVLPADLTMRFRSPRGRAQVRRVKMVRELRAGGLDGLVRRELGTATAVVEPATYRGHEARRATGRERAFTWRWVTAGLRRRTQLLWVCPQRDWMYSVATESRRRDPVAPETFTVRCCGTEAA